MLCKTSGFNALSVIVCRQHYGWQQRRASVFFALLWSITAHTFASGCSTAVFRNRCEELAFLGRSLNSAPHCAFFVCSHTVDSLTEPFLSHLLVVTRFVILNQCFYSYLINQKYFELISCISFSFCTQYNKYKLTVTEQSKEDPILT